jgi:hypothetical protein
MGGGIGGGSWFDLTTSEVSWLEAAEAKVWIFQLSIIQT